MQKSVYILVCASVRTCDDPQKSFNVFNLLARTHNEDAALGSSVSSLFDKKFHRIYNVLRLLRACFGELRKPSNSYKIDVRIFKAQLISGST